MNAYLKKKIISKISPLLIATGIPRIFNSSYGGRGHILMFHRIVPESETLRVHNHLSLEITPEHLEEIIDYFIVGNYCFLSLDELYDCFHSGKYPDEKFVVFTFDDGYKDNLETAYPIFKKYGIPFTVYITTGIPNGTAILWWYILEDMIKNLDAVEFHWKDKKYFYRSITPDEKEKAFEFVQSFVHRHFRTDNYRELFEAVFKGFQLDLTMHCSTLGMTWDEIRILNRDPLVSIGAHTVNHFKLSGLCPEELRREILESRLELEKQLDQPITHFAYPYGKSIHASSREFECTKNLGFKTSTTTKTGNLFGEHASHLCSLPRININRVTNRHVLKMQTSGFLPFIINKGKKIIL